uniref:LIM zinc-binding domain-containing protein n=1 Tax=Pavo cristatus TaxID=9049 RepID=A0A8C9G5Y3_PAVCR
MCPRTRLSEKVSSLGKDWHKFCLKCERCNKTLTPGGHAEHDGKPFCHKPCYATLFGPKGTSGRCLYPAAPIPTPDFSFAPVGAGKAAAGRQRLVPVQPCSLGTR